MREGRDLPSSSSRSYAAILESVRVDVDVEVEERGIDPKVKSIVFGLRYYSVE